jgi:hypothetical protein
MLILHNIQGDNRSEQKHSRKDGTEYCNEIRDGPLGSISCTTIRRTGLKEDAEIVLDEFGKPVLVSWDSESH